MTVLIKGTPLHRAVRNRALELLQTKSKEEVLRQLREETGLPISAQAIGNWASGWMNRGGRPTQEQRRLLPKQERAIAEDQARLRARVAELPHRCSACLGVTGGTVCQWCGAYL